MKGAFSPKYEAGLLLLIPDLHTIAPQGAADLGPAVAPAGQGVGGPLHVLRVVAAPELLLQRSEEHTSELQSP